MDETNRTGRFPLALVGAYLSGDGYPHPTGATRLLRACDAFDVLDLARAVPGSGRMWARGRIGRLLDGALRVARLFALACVSVLAWTRRRARYPTVYVAYPCVPTLLAFALIPRRWRPTRIVADAFVGWYDALVLDRGLFRADSWAARAVRALERRAFRCAQTIVVDTDANGEHLARVLDLPPALFRAAPLVVDESEPAPDDTRDDDDRVRVLFVGTFVPLHGVETLAAAIARLSRRDDLVFEIIGDGQSANAFAEAVGGVDPARIEWHRGFMPLAVLRRRIRRARICLGIFGAGAKAARVWPLKNYLYAQMGKAVITSDRFGSPGCPEDEIRAAFSLVPRDGAALAARIESLVADDAARVGLEARAAAFYRERLSNAAALRALRAIIAPPPPSTPGTPRTP